MQNGPTPDNVTLLYAHIDFHGFVGKVDIEFGQLTALYGPNGSGKSTIMDAIYRVIDGVRDRRVSSVGLIGVKVYGQGTAKLLIGGRTYLVEWSTDEIRVSDSLPDKIPIRHIDLMDLLMTNSDKLTAMVESLVKHSAVMFGKFAESLENLCISDCFDIRITGDGMRVLRIPICEGLDCIIHKWFTRNASLGEFLAVVLLLHAYETVADNAASIRAGITPILLIDWPEVIDQILATRLLDELVKLPLQYIIETRNPLIAQYAVKHGAAYYVKDGSATRITTEDDLPS